MSHGIRLHNPGRYLLDAGRLQRAARAALDCQPERRQSSLTIALADARTIREMNLRYARIDAPTDVLSFPAAQTSAEEEPYLGDIVIAYDYTAAQARVTGAPLADALCLLVIHGTLHLLGYDHGSGEDRDKMWAAQAQALGRLGIDPGILQLYSRGEND